MKEVIYTNEAPEPIGPYSQAIKANGLIFVSGQLPIDNLGEIVSPDISSQAKQVMKNIGEILYIAGNSMDKIVKTTIYLKNLKNFDDVCDVYDSYFQEQPPASSIVEVSNLPKDALVKIDCIAIE